MSKLTVKNRKEALATFYAGRFRCQKLLQPVYYVEKDWSADEYTGGGFVFNYPPGVLTSFGSELRRPIGRVYFAGSETATYWAGCFEGCVQSGERAAREVLHDMGILPASDIWQEEPGGDSGCETNPVDAERFRSPLNALMLSLTSAVVVGIGVVTLFFRRNGFAA
jgi:monoamine oxidase